MSARAAPGRTVYHGTHLRVMVTPAEHLLAMKVMASRPASDADDIRTLIALLGISTRAAVLDLVQQHFPDDPLPTRALDLLEDIVSDVERGGDSPTSAPETSPRATRQPAPRCDRLMKRVRGRCCRPRGHHGPCRR
jgi:hypothetical protein